MATKEEISDIRIHSRFWADSKLIKFSSNNGRYLPQTIKELLQLFWNVDISIGQVPLLKSFAVFILILTFILK